MKKINKPIVWTFHDMTPFSGGNPYESGIFKDKLELFRPFLNKKIKLFQQHGRIYGHATSDTFKLKAVNQYQTFKDSKTEVIPYPLDPNHFNIIHQDIARTRLNIKSNKPLLLFVAADTNNKRKGIQYLIDSPHIKDFTLLMVGEKSNNLEKSPNIIQLGTLDIPKLNLAYSAADLFITPAIEEAYGQTTIESFYCGTPVVAFPTAGAKQIIQPYKNGIIADTIDNKALYKAINKALSTSFNRKEISIKAKETFNPQKISQQFLSFYNKILQNEK
ncbi:glycosyltransferase [Thermophagus xiamenensis]|uniref:glycosyltransferase n=1 Tax=Thermophagus xiamenensis TaxID=385682 RepID=UPI001300BFA9|nr:glycosyltransferase [Thermophagus xiamenensis]